MKQHPEPPYEEQQAAVRHTERKAAPQNVMAQKVASFMRTVLYTIAADETALMAWELLERSGSRHLPVVRPDGHCAGLLDRADLAVACAAPATSLSGLRVGDLLLRHRSATVQAEQTVAQAANLMRYTQCDALPVMGDHGQLVGLLTAADLVAACAGHPPPREELAGPPPQIPYPVMPGLPPRRRHTGRDVP